MKVVSLKRKKLVLKHDQKLVQKDVQLTEGCSFLLI